MITLVLNKLFLGPNFLSSQPVILIEINIKDKYVQILENHISIFLKQLPIWLSKFDQTNNENKKLYITKFIASLSVEILKKNHTRNHSAGIIEIDGKTIIWIGYHDPKASLNCVKLVCSLLERITKTKITSKELILEIEKYSKAHKYFNPDSQISILMEAADELNIPYSTFFPAYRYWRFGWGHRSRIYFESSSEKDSNLGGRILRNKAANKIFMKNLGAPTADHILISNIDELDHLNASIKFPCVVKPIDLSKSQGVTVNIKKITELKEAFIKTRKLSTAPLMIESYIEGDIHRLLVVEGNLIAANKRMPPLIIGDGNSTIIELAKRLNETKQNRDINGDYFGLVPFDSEFDQTLSNQGFSRNDVPQKNSIIKLRSIPLMNMNCV